MTLNKLSLAIITASSMALTGCFGDKKSSSPKPSAAAAQETTQQEPETKKKTLRQLIIGIDRYLGYSEHNKYRKRILTDAKVLEVAVTEEAPRAVMLKPEHFGKVLNSEPAVTAFAKNTQAFDALMADTTARERFLANQNAVSVALKEENARNTLTSIDESDNIDDTSVLETVLQAESARSAVLASEATLELINQAPLKQQRLLTYPDANQAYKTDKPEVFNTFAQSDLGSANNSNAGQALGRVFGSTGSVDTDSLNNNTLVKAAIDNQHTREQLLAADGPYLKPLVGKDSFSEVLKNKGSVDSILNNTTRLTAVLAAKASALASSSHFIAAAKTANADSMQLLLKNEHTRSKILSDINSQNNVGYYTNIIAAATAIVAETEQNTASLTILENPNLKDALLQDSAFVTAALQNEGVRNLLVTAGNLPKLKEAKVGSSEKLVIFSHQPTVEKIFADADLIVQLDAADIAESKFSNTDLYEHAITTAADSVDTYRALKRIVDSNEIDNSSATSSLATIVLNIPTARTNALGFNDNSIREDVLNAAFASRQSSRTGDAAITGDSNFIAAATAALNSKTDDTASKAFVTDLIRLYQNEATALNSGLFNENAFIDAVWNKREAKNYVLNQLKISSDSTTIKTPLKNKIEGNLYSLIILGKDAAKNLSIDAKILAREVNLQGILQDNQPNHVKARFVFSTFSLDPTWRNFHDLRNLEDIIDINNFQVLKDDSNFVKALESDFTYQWAENKLTIWLHNPSITEIKIPAQPGLGLAEDAGVTIVVDSSLTSKQLTPYYADLSEVQNKLLDKLFVLRKNDHDTYFITDYSSFVTNHKYDSQENAKSQFSLAINSGLIKIIDASKKQVISEGGNDSADQILNEMNTSCTTTCNWSLQRSNSNPLKWNFMTTDVNFRSPKPSKLVMRSGIFETDSNNYFISSNSNGNVYLYPNRLKLKNSRYSDFYNPIRGLATGIHSLKIHKNPLSGSPDFFPDNIDNFNFFTSNSTNDYTLTYERLDQNEKVHFTELTFKHLGKITDSLSANVLDNLFTNTISASETHSTVGNGAATIKAFTASQTPTDIQLKKLDSLIVDTINHKGASFTISAINIFVYGSAYTNGKGFDLVSINFEQSPATVTDFTDKDITGEHDFRMASEGITLGLEFAIKDVNGMAHTITEYVHIKPDTP